MLHLRDGRFRVAALLATLLTFPSLLGCEGERAAQILGRAPATISCSLSSASIAAGSTQPIVVSVLVTRESVGSPGERVQFGSDIGDVAPDAVFTDGNGFAASNFFPPATPGGTAMITATIIDGSEELIATCLVTITVGTSDPLLSISVQTPPQVAGLAVTVGYNASLVDLPRGAVELLGNLASSDCFSIVDDDEVGEVEVVVTCPTMRPVGGADAMRLGFQNIGGTLVGLEGFSITCTSVNEGGSFLATLCRGRVTQI